MLVLLNVTSEIVGTVKFFNSRVRKGPPADTLPRTSLQFPAQHLPRRLAIYGRVSNDSHVVGRLLRNAGHRVRSRRMSDGAEMSRKSSGFSQDRCPRWWPVGGIAKVCEPCLARLCRCARRSCGMRGGSQRPLRATPARSAV